MTKIVLALLTLTTAGEASAQSNPYAYVTADRLHEWCQQRPDAALNYVAGVLDAVALNGSPAMCIPADSTLAQARDIVCKYLRDNLGKRHYNTVSSVWTAQSEVWPCKK